ncbi:hypothetical protein R1sor_015787 [Riccia sorocarpa]|uniref:Uncharacterized protein n=1 Tax=Riccia sorocarpa TaxID=122646 RepID=A0ABD3HD72_9MARC
MDQPHRPHYPSDRINYHAIRRPNTVQVIRIFEDLLDTYTSLRHALGPTTSHAAVLRYQLESTRLEAEDDGFAEFEEEALEETAYEPGVGDRLCSDRAFGVDARFVFGGATHLVVRAFLNKHITAAKMRFYVRAIENFMSETFHSVIEICNQTDSLGMIT